MHCNHKLQSRDLSVMGQVCSRDQDGADKIRQLRKAGPPPFARFPPGCFHADPASSRLQGLPAPEPAQRPGGSSSFGHTTEAAPGWVTPATQPPITNTLGQPGDLGLGASAYDQIQQAEPLPAESARALLSGPACPLLV